MKLKIALKPGAPASNVRAAILICKVMLAEIRYGGPVTLRYTRVKETKVRAHVRQHHLRGYYARVKEK